MKFDLQEEGAVLTNARAKRIAECGTFGHVICQEIGLKKKYTFLCGVWHECERCFKIRVKEVIAPLKNYLTDHTSLKMCYMTEHDWRLYSKRTRNAASYRRIPQANDTCLVFFAAEINCGTELTDILDLDWQAIVSNMPEDARITGKLGKIEKPDYGMLQSQVVIVDDTTADEKAFLAAVAETAALNPQTPEELQSATDIRLRAYIKHLNLEGIPYETRLYRETIRTLDYNWLNAATVLLQLVNQAKTKRFKA